MAPGNRRSLVVKRPRVAGLPVPATRAGLLGVLLLQTLRACRGPRPEPALARAERRGRGTWTRAAPLSNAAGLPVLPAGATELTEKRTEYSRTFRDAAGKMTTEFYTSPLFYRPAGSDAYEPVVLGFRVSADPAFTAVSDRAPVTVAVAPATAKGGFLATASGPYTIAFHLPADLAKAAGTVAPVVSGPVADYAELPARGRPAGDRRDEGCPVLLHLARDPG